MSNLKESFSGFAVSVNCVVFGYSYPNIEVLLLREINNNREYWSLPGDGMNGTDNFNGAAKRVLNYLHGNDDVYFSQSMVSGDLSHFDKGTLLKVVYFATVEKNTFLNSDIDIYDDLRWFPLKDINDNVTDDKAIIEESFERLKRLTKLKPLGFYLLENKFTFHELQRLYEVVLNEVYDRPNFRRKMLATGLLEELDEVQTDVGHRPAKKYSFNVEKYKLISKRGYELRL